MVRRIFLSLFFALLLVFAQQAAVVHGYVHTADLQQSSQNDKQSPKHNEVCAQCVALADISGAIGAKSYVFKLDAGQQQPWPALQLALAGTTRLYYRSRAPPSLA